MTGRGCAQGGQGSLVDQARSAEAPDRSWWTANVPLNCTAMVGGAALAAFALGWEGPVERFTIAVTALWAVAVVAVIRSDLQRFIIPDEASFAIAALGLTHAAAPGLIPALDGALLWASLVPALLNGTAAFALFWGIGRLFRWWRGRDALGFGDVKLAGASALWLDAADGVTALEVAALSAIVVLLVRRRGPVRDAAVPFGAFMAPAAWLVFVAGPAVRAWWDAGP